MFGFFVYVTKGNKELLQRTSGIALGGGGHGEAPAPVAGSVFGLEQEDDQDGQGEEMLSAGGDDDSLCRSPSVCWIWEETKYGKRAASGLVRDVLPNCKLNNEIKS